MESVQHNYAQNRSEWRCLVKHSVHDLNIKAEQEEKCRKNFHKRSCEERQRQAESALHCSSLGFTVIAANKVGMHDEL